MVMPDPTQHTTTMQWLASLYKIMGKEKANKFIRDLGATKPILAESFAPSAERVSTGETPIAISLVRYVVTFAAKTAPVDYVRLGKMLSTGQYLALSHKAPRPNAGKAFIDFFLTPESMELLAKAGEFVTMKGIPQLLPDADKITPVEMDDLDQKGSAVGSLFDHSLGSDDLGVTTFLIISVQCCRWCQSSVLLYRHRFAAHREMHGYSCRSH